MLDIQNLSIKFIDKDYDEAIVKDVSFHVANGEILGIAGESGSGKTLTAYAIDGILPENALISHGNIFYNNQNLLELDKKLARKLRGKEIGMVFQEPLTSLNPLYKIGYQVEENLRLHTNYNALQRKKLALEMLEAVELKDVERVYHSYPHQLSGGMRQRVMIAAALVHKPNLLIADEPTTALDVIVQSNLIKLFRRLNKEYGIAIMFISHNLRVLSKLCDNIIVMKKGVIVEQGTVKDIFNSPKHAYTKSLIESVGSL